MTGVVEVEENLTSQQMNEAIANLKHHLREYFGEDLERVNEVRFKLTRVLKEFNRHQSKWLARLEVQPCDISFLCKEDSKTASYEVWVLERKTEDLVAKIYLDYDLSNNVKRLLGIHESSDYYVLTFNETLDILNLAVKLMHAFTEA